MSTRPRIERIDVKLPDGFDPAKHVDSLTRKIIEKHGAGWEIDNVNIGANTATASRNVAVNEVQSNADNSETIEVRLRRDTKPADGDKMAAKLESQHEGYMLTTFEPFLGYAVMTKLSVDAARARGAISVALGVKPWDIQIEETHGGGFDFSLPRSFVPSKHYDKLQEVAEAVVGVEGWYAVADAQKLRGKIVPSDPPTFPSAVPYPFRAQIPSFDPKRTDWARIPLGIKLGQAEEPGEQLCIDLSSSAHGQITGISGGGKAQPLTARIPVPVSARFPNGWATMGSLEPGDELFSGNATVTRALGFSDTTTQDVFEVTTEDGRVVQATPDHLWRVSDRADRRAFRYSGRPEVIAERTKRKAQASRLRTIAAALPTGAGMSLLELSEVTGEAPTMLVQFLRRTGIPCVKAAAPSGVQHNLYAADEALVAYASALSNLSGNGRPLTAQWTTLTTLELAEAIERDPENTWGIRVAPALELPEAQLPVDPYVFGAWLGDGTTRQGAITTMEPEVVEAVVAAGYEVRGQDSTNTGLATTYRFAGLGTDLRKLGFAKSHGDPQRKFIPATYLRSSASQRLRLLQGLMDTDGSIASNGRAEFCVTSKVLAYDVLELVRSLGIRASITEGPASITEQDPDMPGSKRRRVVGTRYRVKFSTSMRIATLPAKVERLPLAVTERSKWAIVKSVKKVGTAEARCVLVEHAEHLYLTESFVPTHNTVAINAFIFGLLARGYELAVVDVKHKSVDFEWARDLVRDGGWGCESIAAGVATLSLIIAEGERRSKVIKEHGVQKWQELPASAGVRPIAVVLDEVTALFMMEEVPKGLPKDNSLVVEANQANLEKAVLRKLVSKIAAEWRFAGVHIFLATQMSQNNTGIPPTIKINLGNRVLFGANPNDAARGHAFMDARAVPKVPANIQSDSDANRGVGAAELEGQGAPSVFKAYFATTKDYRSHLMSRGVPVSRRPEPTASEVAKYSPSLMDDEEPPSRMREEFGGFKDAPRPQSDHGLKGAAAAAHELKVAEKQAAKAALAKADADAATAAVAREADGAADFL